MAVIREITIDWGIQSSPGGTTVLHFAADELLANQRTAIGTFLAAIALRLSNTTSMTVATQGREFDDETGELTGEWNTTTSIADQGEFAGSAVPNASQILVRLKTGVVSNGRFLQGRFFIPGAASNTDTAGEVTGTVVTAIAGAAQNLAVATDLLVWSRPQAARAAGPGGVPAARPARAGTSAEVVNATVWNEYAVLRRRR